MLLFALTLENHVKLNHGLAHPDFLECGRTQNIIYYYIISAYINVMM